jgi:hypothetical protein
MPDAATTAGLLNSNLTTILNFISAAAGLGAAAMGLVDSSKAFWGGPSNFGFSSIENEVGPFLIAAAGGPTAFGRAQILQTLRANWLNGVAKGEQKAKAKALIHLGLSRGNAAALANAAGVDGATLTSLVQKTADGITPTQQEINVLGQFDAIVSAVLDAAYERGDQQYRNACKFLGLVVSTILGGLGGWVIYGSGMTGWQFGLSLIVGLSATPLAPVAKDLASSIQAAAGAVGSVTR